MELEEMPIPKKPLLKRQDRIYIEDGKVFVHKKRELKLNTGEILIEYYIEKTDMSMSDYLKSIIDHNENES